MRSSFVDANGYRRVWAPDSHLAHANGYVFEHRLVVYEAGLELPAGCHVHHKNGVRDDNRLENLEVINSNGEHVRLHLEEAGFVRNQWGVWPVLAPAQRKERERARVRECQRIRNGFYDRNPDAEPAYLPLYERHFGRAVA